MNAITAEVIRRVFPVMKHNNSKEILGTSFTIREKEKEFLITAYHVAEHAIDKNTNEISLIIGKGTLGTRIHEKIIHIDEEQDIIVCKAPEWMYKNRPQFPPLKSTLEMNQGEGLSLGQEVMYMGYPRGCSGVMKLPDTKTDIGIVGKGILGAFELSKPEITENKKGFIIEGRMDQGYSGGPIVLKDINKPQGQTYVLGVISARIHSRRKLKSEEELLDYDYSFTIAGNLGMVMKKVHEKQSC